MKYSEVYKLMKQAYVRELVKKAAFETDQVNPNKAGNSIKRGPQYYSYFGPRPQFYKQDSTQQNQPYTGGGTAVLTPESKVINTNDMNDIQRPAKTYNTISSSRDRITSGPVWKEFFRNQVNSVPRGGVTVGTTTPKRDVNVMPEGYRSSLVSGPVKTPISLPPGQGFHAYKKPLR